MKKNLKLIIFLSVQFTIVLIICLIVLFEGKKDYTVTFNLNGGECVSGEVVQTVRYGKSAQEPAVKKEGFSLVGWSEKFNNVTKDVEVFAMWECQTTYGIEFEIIGNYCLVSGCFDDISGNVYISSFYQGKKVLGIKDDAFRDCKNINYVYIEHGMISIGNNAFRGCSNLTCIDIAPTVEVFGTNILTGCNKLVSIFMPFVGNSIFDNSSPYFGYLFGASDYTNAYRFVPSTVKNVILTADQPIPDFAFYKCSKLKTVTMYGKTEYIGSNAFRNCKGLESVILSHDTKEIGKAAFANCTSLKGIELPTSLEIIQEGVFGNCSSLAGIIINSNLKEIASNAFQNCATLKEFIIKDNPNFISESNKLYVINGYNIQEYVITLETYKDETDNLKEKFPPFILDPEKFEGKLDVDFIIDEEKEAVDDLIKE